MVNFPIGKTCRKVLLVSVVRKELMFTSSIQSKIAFFCLLTATLHPSASASPIHNTGGKDIYVVMYCRVQAIMGPLRANNCLYYTIC